MQDAQLSGNNQHFTGIWELHALSPPSPPLSPTHPTSYSLPSHSPHSPPPPQETKKKQQLKVKMQMARFLQETIKDMAVSSKNPNKKESVEEFSQFFDKVQQQLLYGAGKMVLCVFDVDVDS